ncbi:hypothetical protein [Streptomyces olivaceus]|uniref:hypothetical protein n=1 Tax=Streptomyces olivaceus TaxID=47716 RepID=UPI001CCB13BF|nr:hypothetical protein [Streptomyces olivaceus]MBZ6230859.1 hypothetical protein [Streptomyces olivaceus]
MTHDGGLPYEECRRAQRVTPRRYRRLDGAAVSGLLTVLCVATLLVTITVAL